MTEDTKTEDKKIADANTVLIEEAMRDLKEVPAEGELATNPIVHRGDETLPAPMVATVKDDNRVPMWDTITHERSLILMNMARAQLGKMRPNGTPYFTARDPGILPKRGSHKCMLHMESPNRDHYTDLGFAICSKSNLANPYQVSRHMQRKHKDEWSAIEEEKRLVERQEDREVYRAIARLGDSRQVEDVKPKPIYVGKEEKVNPLTCPDCGKTYAFKKAFKTHLKTHK